MTTFKVGDRVLIDGGTRLAIIIAVYDDKSVNYYYEDEHPDHWRATHLDCLKKYNILPKVKVKKSGWIIVEHRDTIKGKYKAIAQCPVFDTEEKAKDWASHRPQHVKIESAKYYKIEWEEEISQAKVDDDDMV